MKQVKSFTKNLALKKMPIFMKLATNLTNGLMLVFGNKRESLKSVSNWPEQNIGTLFHLGYKLNDNTGKTKSFCLPLKLSLRIFFRRNQIYFCNSRSSYWICETAQGTLNLEQL